MQDANGKFLFERFTTVGVPEKAHKSLGFVCYYEVNTLIKPPVRNINEVQKFMRVTDMVRCTGININLEMMLQPKCGWRFRIMMFQTPYTMDDINKGHADDMPRNRALYTADNQQGYYAPNAQLLTNHHVQPNGEYECSLNPKFNDLFKYQRNNLDVLNYHTVLHSMRVSAPFCTVIYDKHTYFINRRNKMKKVVFNRLIPMSTTWKYEPTMHDDIIDNHPQDEQDPDRKVYIMIIGTPVTGGLNDPGQNMHGWDPEHPLEAQDPDEIFVHRQDREGSVVAPVKTRTADH
ncbi:hypothetical protein F5148DRAFT_1292092 [Russula earlei]|uniref:Uncharacterized protein n=1 Tax=Russula earlei TaxID=71964 RepID=A0ACC0TVB1_9AGAM|nr:hypothetical protein F5148DRAFT_1292092 [Russula earlei]